MSNDFELSRRKALAALGTIGVASAGAGLGTSAYFSDQETFENNRLVAGELDLKMDWEEHYSDWSDDEDADFDETGTKYEVDNYANESGTGEFEVLMTDPASDGDDSTDPANYTAFPPGADSPLIWVPNSYVDDFMANTSIEAFPDDNNDGIAEYPRGQMVDNNQTACDFLADVGADDEGLEPSGLRTNNDDTNDDGTGLPLINLQDVKPGDFGEITFSTHLCDNPGYLWMNMPGGLTESENGVNEAEADDPDEDAGGEYPEDATNIPGEPELADAIQTAIWYDGNCNNLHDGELEPVDIIVLADKSGSIEEDQMDALKAAGNFFAESLPQGNLPGSSEPIARTGLISFSESEQAAQNGARISLESPQEAIGPVDQFLDGSGNGTVDQLLPESGDGSTPLPQALDLAREVLNAEGRPNANQYILLVSDGAPDYNFETQYPLQDPDNNVTTIDGISATVSGSSENFDDVVEDPDGNPYISDIFRDGTLSDMEQETRLVARDIDTSPQTNTVRNGNPISGEDGIDIITVALQSPNLTSTQQNNLNSLMEAVATNTGLNFKPGFTIPELNDAIQDILNTILVLEAEEIIFQGTLSEAETVLTDGNGLPLDGDPASTEFDEQNDPDSDDDRECFSGTNCFGFSWWLPVDHANEIQSDSASFDIGFYTEQCRHNDGSGMNNEQVTPSETDA